MKKFIFPILICIVTLTSCSKALYKDKYDWVKVDRIESVPVGDSAPANQPVLRSMTEYKSSAEPRNISDQTLEPLVRLPATNEVPGDTVPAKRSKKEEKEKSNKGYVTIDPHLDFSIGKRMRDPSREKNMTTEDKGYIAGGIGLVLLVIAVVAIGPASIPILLMLIYGFLAILSIVAAVLFIYAICWLFRNFLFMFDN